MTDLTNLPAIRDARQSIASYTLCDLAALWVYAQGQQGKPNDNALFRAAMALNGGYRPKAEEVRAIYDAGLATKE